MNVLSQLSIFDILDLIPDPIVIVDTLGNIEFSNPFFANLLGFTTHELYHQNIINYLVDDSIFNECLIQLQNSGICDNQTTIFITKDKQHITTTKNVRLLHANNKELMLVSLKDISNFQHITQKLQNNNIELEQKSKRLNTIINEREEELTHQQIQLDKIINLVDEIIWYIDDKTMKIKYVSNAIEKIFLQKKDNFLNNSSLWMDMIYDEDKPKVMDFFENKQNGTTAIIDFRIKRKDNSTRWLSSTITHHPFLKFFIGVTRDITDQKKYQEQIKFMAYHDSLTGLPNRAYLTDTIELLIKKSKTVQQDFAILFLDLDNFKYINDSMGHDVGDKVLIRISNKLTQIIKNKATCIRFGGDEFIIVINNTKNKKNLNVIIKTIIEKISQPFIIKGREFFISCSIGISLYPKDALTSTKLITAADTAMYKAKLSGKNRHTFYDQSMDQDMYKFFKIENTIKDALLNNYFSLYFQPIICAQTSSLCGFEALIRLNHPKFGVLSPEVFIPIAEASGDIIKITNFVITKACLFAKEINLLSRKKIIISINISAKQFKEKNFAKNFLKYIKSNNFSANLIKIEIVESAIIENIESAIKELQLLRNAGIQISLDDFGTGYSSFSYLAKLPIDTIKIDKSFVIDMPDNEDNQHIINAITSLAHNLNKDVVAEGVETTKHIKFLKHANIDMFQGFYFSKAVSREEILDGFENYKQMFNLI